jgi:hypothetical protein
MTGVVFLIPCNWPETADIPETLTIKGQEIRVVSVTGGGLNVNMNPNLAWVDHEEAVREAIRGHPPAHRLSFVPETAIAVEDLDAMQPAEVPVWDSLFRKPAPVVDLFGWVESPLADQFIYLPNQIRKQGADAEEYITNAQYTEVLTNAYRVMCLSLGIHPEALLEDGQTRIACWTVQPHEGAQLSYEGARSARLANSRLYDYDDSAYAKDFLRALIGLSRDQYESESIHRTVLAKAEYILMGKTSHTYNQKFMRRFVTLFEALDGTISDRVLNILSGMLADGLVLEDSVEEFKARVIRGRLDGDLDQLLKIYGECHEQ